MLTLFTTRPRSLPVPHLLLLVGLLLLGACNTTDPTTGTTKVEGQVVEQQSRQPVGNGTVQVWLAGKGGGYGQVGPAYPCDASGHFSFAFEAGSKNGYLLKAEAPPGYITSWSYAPELTAGRKNKDVMIPVLAPAWVRLVLVDEPPKSKVSIYTSGYEGNGDRIDNPDNVILIRPCVAGLTKQIYWSITDDQGIMRWSS